MHGQNRHPEGLFYGGAGLQEEARLLGEWLHNKLAAATSVFAIDLHTGLGAFGASTPIAEPLPGSDATSLSHRLGLHVQCETSSPATDSVRGSFGCALPRLLPQARIECVPQEIDTAPPLQVLHALREENRRHNRGDDGDHACKQTLLAAPCPADKAWRNTAIRQGCLLAYRVATAHPSVSHDGGHL